MNLEIGKHYKTKGGWVAFISTCINGKPQGRCSDSFDMEEPSMGTWDKNTGKCLKRGNSVEVSNTEPYDIIDTD